MTTFLSGVVGGIIAVLILDTVGSLLSQRLKFQYARLSIISWMLWAAAGAVASRSETSKLTGVVIVGWLAGLLVGAVDSTLGWWISWQIGPGRLQPELQTAPKIARIIFTVSMFAGFAGAIGALLFGLK